jgi:hypothetical protein
MANRLNGIMFELIFLSLDQIKEILMKKIAGMVMLVALAIACKPNENTSEFTGNQTVYALQQASQYVVSGTVTFKEKRDGSALLAIDLTGTSGNSKYPVHLHLGDLTTQGASVAALLNPLDGNLGKSETTITQLADETIVTYASLIKLGACVKIHLAESGAGRDVILAAGNVGASATKSSANGRLGVAVCQ